MSPEDQYLILNLLVDGAQGTLDFSPHQYAKAERAFRKFMRSSADASDVLACVVAEIKDGKYAFENGGRSGFLRNEALWAEAVRLSETTK